MRNSDDIEARVKDIDERTKRIEQTLPTLATKDDLKVFPTQDDLKGFATKDDLKEEGERTRRHFDVVAEAMKQDIALVIDGHDATKAHVESRLNEFQGELSAHDQRIMQLEAKSLKRR